MRPPLEQLPIVFPPLSIPEDHARAAAQRQRVHETLAHSAWVWWTLAELAAHTGDPEASVSARLRDLRKPQYGEHVVEKRRRGHGRAGTWEYRLA